MKNYRGILALTVIAGGLILMGASALAASVTVDINGKEIGYAGKVIVRQGGGNRVPITIVTKDNRLFQFYRSEERVVRIKADAGKKNIVLDDTLIYDEPSETSNSPAKFLKGLEVEIVDEPQDGWVQVKAMKDFQGWIKVDELGAEVDFVKAEDGGSAAE